MCPLMCLQLLIRFVDVLLDGRLQVGLFLQVWCSEQLFSVGCFRLLGFTICPRGPGAVRVSPSSCLLSSVACPGMELCRLGPGVLPCAFSPRSLGFHSTCYSIKYVASGYGDLASALSHVAGTAREAQQSWQRKGKVCTQGSLLKRNPPLRPSHLYV